jgi:hypothetical protein
LVFDCWVKLTTVLLRESPPFLTIGFCRTVGRMSGCEKTLLIHSGGFRTNDRPDRPNRLFANWPGGMDGPDDLIRGFEKELDN